VIQVEHFPGDGVPGIDEPLRAVCHEEMHEVRSNFQFLIMLLQTKRFIRSILLVDYVQEIPLTANISSE
jgi:hypothetical protein